MSIADTFRNGTVFVTGSTGFLGKILTEKLLRSCDVKCIAILVRGKYGVPASQRAADTLKQSIFDRLRFENPNFVTKIKTIDGHIDKQSLGISTEDCDWLIKNVNFVFHSAATVKFNETIDIATKLNIQGTENVLELAAKMNYLKGFVYVSTAYSNCPRSEIKEVFYDVPISAKELKKLIEIDGKTRNVLEDWPNTYTFTKALAENIISTNENQLPISVFRPSIIGCAQSEPEPGWMNSMQGLVYIVNSIMLGLLRAIPMSMDKKTDIVPIDYTANALISVMWDTVNRYQDGSEKNKKPKIYSYVSGFDSPVHWGTFLNYVYETYYQAPPLQSVWYIFCIYSANSWFINFMRLLLHRIPAAFVDLSSIIRGKNSKMLKMYKKQDGIIDSIEWMLKNEWKFDNSNTRKLWAQLSQEDRKTFWFGFEDFDWKSYTQTMVYGIRKIILHEDLHNMTRALSKNRKLFWLHHFSIFLIIYIVFQLCWTFVM
ncbi:unnamed protein product [Macrosiphum euphorbiae]|uniref:Fatty acyl-CoA reductase n=1 Tax=Macrosiphum euphorbiae TaxID=13131 RepID=A0AAV0XHR6_9HEMI|nr:unnamed protein product [Macrosiphum euphorbiae]